MEHVSEFIEFMRGKNCSPHNPSDIIANNQWNDYQIEQDAKGKLKGYYILTIEGDHISGACGDRREGLTHQYNGTPTRKFTDEERRKYAKKRQELQERKEAEILKNQEQAALEAKKQWSQATQSPHKYLNSKGITPEFTRTNPRGFLLIPMFYNKSICNLQSIGDDGTKLFKKGGKKKGCFCPLAKPDDDKSTIFICEGFATGKSIRGVMPNSPVLVAFDAGNLIHVAKDKRKEYPNAKIVICADNDTETLIQGKPKNVGVIKATKAAEAVSGIMIKPEFAPDDTGSDFNDYEREYGEDALREYLNKVMNNTAPTITHNQDAPPDDWLNERPPIEAYDEETAEAVSLYEDKEEKPVDDSWKSYLSKDSSGKLKSRALNNVSLILEYSDKFKDMFCYDEFANEKKLVQCPPWESPKKFKPRTQSDEDVTWLTCELEKHGITAGMQNVKKVLDAVIMKKRRNPAKEYFSKLEWDGVPRLDSWLAYYAGAKFDDEEYVSAVGKKFMTALVSRVMNAGCKFDHMLILEGGQGVGKSTMLKTLATIHGDRYFTDTLEPSQLGTDKAVSIMQGVLIVEFAELAGLSKTDMDRFKQQITVQEDRVVLKYKNEPTDRPRQFVLVGTINPKDGYLDDPTGLRRFWPVKVGDEFKLTELEQDREQLFAEAMELYRAKYPLWMDKDLSARLEKVQESRRLIAPWQPDLEELTKDKEFLIQRELWEALNIEKSRRNSKDMATIAKIMTGLGWEQCRKLVGDSKLTGWRKKVA